MKLAEKFGLPLFTFVDTPGAYPGIGAEERGQSEAIGRNLYEMAGLRVPIIVTVIGEGGSGGALAIGVGDLTLMLQYSTYSVISPEGCASILWKSAEQAPEAAETLGITAARLKQLGLVDKVVHEPLGGAHRDHAAMTVTLKKALTEALRQLQDQPLDTLLEDARGQDPRAMASSRKSPPADVGPRRSRRCVQRSRGSPHAAARTRRPAAPRRCALRRARFHGAARRASQRSRELAHRGLGDPRAPRTVRRSRRLGAILPRTLRARLAVAMRRACASRPPRPQTASRPSGRDARYAVLRPRRTPTRFGCSRITRRPGGDAAAAARAGRRSARPRRDGDCGTDAPEACRGCVRCSTASAPTSTRTRATHGLALDRRRLATATPRSCATRCATRSCRALRATFPGYPSTLARAAQHQAECRAAARRSRGADATRERAGSRSGARSRHAGAPRATPIVPGTCCAGSCARTGLPAPSSAAWLDAAPQCAGAQPDARVPLAHAGAISKCHRGRIVVHASPPCRSSARGAANRS